MTKQLLWQGSSKDVWFDPQRPRCLTFQHTDRVSVFDIGPIPVKFAGLGALRCAIATRLFRVLEAADIPTHFISRVSETEVDVQVMDVPEQQIHFLGATGRLLPLEFIDRFMVSNTFMARLERGDVDRSTIEQLVVGGMVAVDAPMCPPFVECSTKHRAADAYVTDEVAAQLAGLSVTELQDVYDHYVRPAVTCLHRFFAQTGFVKLDGKNELAQLKDGSFCLVDCISPDEMRLVGPDGRSYDKDPVRRWYEINYPQWVHRVRMAKAVHPGDKAQWPSYEDTPPQRVIDEVVRRYRVVAEAIDAL